MKECLFITVTSSHHLVFILSQIWYSVQIIINRSSCHSYLTATPLDLHSSAVFLSPSLRFGCFVVQRSSNGSVFTPELLIIFLIIKSVYGKSSGSLSQSSFIIIFVSEFEDISNYSWYFKSSQFISTEDLVIIIKRSLGFIHETSRIHFKSIILFINFYSL